ncbi:gliding motility-associated C-terminal domain-containing protein [Marivirga sp. S37H4]|uniref:Gliding motility-associated C-terminal domain-containing protein n=1 Tax=Marivirga aurantiaca TaxID=2802615 RepID=A0A934X089_9BACT|nr:gliding motility-associated C-terminal domain-containing protein [Marivirga aurantiaca]MBK6266508.1 gliding motility-associated C-terminal domain-containing protein [Marivirga aurantiaca]
MQHALNYLFNKNSGTSSTKYFIFFFIFFAVSYHAASQQTAKRDVDGRGYLEYLPPGYNDNTELYPVIIFLHGHGERGDGSPGALEEVKKNGPPKLIKNGHTMCFEYNGTEECFIVLSPQQSTNRHGWLGYEVMPFVNNALSTYRIDPNRIYLTGLSMGGQGTWQAAYSPENNPNVFAALSPIAGRGDYDDACIIAENETPVWAFHGSNDNAIGLSSGERPINGMIACGADPAPIFTIYDGVGHAGTWDRAYKPDNSLHTPNLYQWFLAQNLENAPTMPPTVNAGTDQEITLPENSVELQATANDNDGSISTILWTRTSGPNNPTSSDLDQLNLQLDDLIQGVYIYVITVIDDDGLSASDEVKITVLPEPANAPPDVDAGSSQNITLPENSVSLHGQVSDPDGNIESTLWEQVDGPNSAVIDSPNDLSTLISGMEEGNYTFSLTAVDDDGEEVSDNVSITVQPEPANDPPSADAGDDQEVTLPDNSITLVGSGTDSDGTVESYLWKQTSGPTTATTTDLSLAELTITELVQGAYVFKLTVTDNDGDTDSDHVTINVLPAPPNDPPVADAGSDVTITLPENSVELVGSGSDADGEIVDYTWAQESGPGTADFYSPNQPETPVSGLEEGLYVFSLSVTDNDGDSDIDNVQVTVLPAPPNEPPTVNAGNDQLITLPTNMVELTATASDSDGEIVEILWKQSTGPSTATIDDPNNTSILVTDMEEGIYQFTVVVKDNDGAEESDQVEVTVFPKQNEPPLADAGGNINITLPVDSTILMGSATDSDGEIDSFLWTQITGPSTATIAHANNKETKVSDLVEGVYRFRFTVTDDKGAEDTDQMTLRVLPEPANIPPTADAGEDVYLTLPEDSTVLTGQGTDSDGTIVGYRWELISGSIAELGDLNGQELEVSGLVEDVYIFNLTVEDDRGATGTDQVRIFVNTPNLPPIVNAGEDMTITLPTNSVGLSGTSSDPDGEISYTLWEQVDGPNTSDISDPLALDVTIDNLVEGTYIFILYAEDNEGLNETDEIRITVNPEPPNNPPNVNAGQDLQLVLPVDEVVLNGNVNDSDGSIVTYDWTQLSGPNTLTAENIDSLKVTYSGFEEGTYTIRLIATDDDGAQGSDDVRIVVMHAPGNQLPIADAGSNVEIILPDNTTQLNGNAFDVDGSIASYHWTQRSGPNSAGIVSPNESSTELNNLTEGIYTFRLSVEDNEGGSAFDQINVRVKPEPANQPPTVTAGSNKVIRQPTSSTTLSATAQDSDGTVENVLWTQISGSGDATLTNAETLNLGIDGLIVGTYIFRITVIDDDGVSNYDQANIQVLEALANQSPIVDAGPNQSITEPKNKVSLLGSTEDSDGTIISHSWEQISGPNTATISHPENLETEISGLQIGTYVFELKAIDDQGLEGFDQVNIRVNPQNPNQPPEADAGENIVLVLPDNTATLSAMASDPDGNIQSVEWSQEFGPVTANLSGINETELEVSGLVAGFYVFRFSIIDNEGATDFDDVSVTVNEATPTSPPIVNAGADQTIVLPHPSVKLVGEATNIDGTIEEIRWEQLSGPSETVIASENTFETEVSGFEPGTYVFRLVVLNSEGLQNFDLVNILANENQMPFAFAGNDTTMVFPVEHFVAVGQGLDNDGSIESVEWSQVSGPSDALLNTPNENKTSVGELVIGNYQFVFKVTDDKGGEATDILNVEVVTYAGNQPPEADAGEDIIVELPNKSAILSGSGEDPDGEIENTQWTLIEGSDIMLSKQGKDEILVEGLELGGYVFQLSVTDNGGLMAYDSVRITVVPSSGESSLTVSMTKLFTPNGDGVNDLWESNALNEMGPCSIQIFNRLGVKVFANKTYENNWNGTDSNGVALDEGAYFYILSCDNGFQRKGGVRIKK